MQLRSSAQSISHRCDVTCNVRLTFVMSAPRQVLEQVSPGRSRGLLAMGIKLTRCRLQFSRIKREAFNCERDAHAADSVASEAILRHRLPSVTSLDPLHTARSLITCNCCILAGRAGFGSVVFSQVAASNVERTLEPLASNGGATPTLPP